MQSITSVANENERINLLQQISTLESKGLGDSVSTRALRDLKSRYNALVEASIQRVQHPDLFQYLPTEIWMQILLDVIDDDCLNLLPLLQVCQRWIPVLVSEPRLWTSIYVRGDLDALELAHSALFLSKDQPLCMTVDIPIVSVVQERFLQREANRIQHLKIKAMSGYFQTWGFANQQVNIIEDLLKGLGPLSSLESLTIGIDTITSTTLSPALRFLNAPNVKYLTPVLSFEDISAFSTFTRLRSLQAFLSLETTGAEPLHTIRRVMREYRPHRVLAVIPDITGPHLAVVKSNELWDP
ncbi:hypothetical protein CPB86DRAFT_814582 [Serendipita vermifera]|nr:hypothetical protein CPB86DRAFT_814582 [Serendipita vermifera]